MTPAPAEAGRNIKSWAMVDALIGDFERGAEQKPMPGQTIETIQKLRERLGL